MRTSDSDDFFKDFPRLRGTQYTEMSPVDARYNCFAWAVGAINCRWDPCYPWFWPRGCPREVTISAFVQAFGTLGYEPCDYGRLETGYDKIVLYMNKGEPTHAARQLRNGRWTSKLGKDVDIEHKVKDLEGPRYGKIAMYFRRPRQKRIATIKRIQPLNSC